MIVYQPGFRCFTASNCKNTKISNNLLRVHINTAKKVELIHELVKKYSPTNHRFLVTPYWAGAYALFEAKSPMWNIYVVYPANVISQKQEIERIKVANPDFILLLNRPVDNNSKIHFKNLQPLTFQYLESNFKLIKNNLPEREYRVYLKENKLY